MSRLVRMLCLTTAVGIGGSAWLLLRPGEAVAQIPIQGGRVTVGGETTVPVDPLAAALHEARRRCDVAAVDAVVTRANAACREAPADPAPWHALANALLERCNARHHLRGIAPGRPLHETLPPEVEADVREGLLAAATAREHGDDSGDLFRIEAGLLGQRITGVASALLWNGKVAAALRAAAERDPEDPLLHTALGVRKLFAPSWLGQDLGAAREHFDYAAAALSDDERPLVFAAMVEALAQRRQTAIERLAAAIARNPANRFAQVVLQRLRRGEDDPFGRDVSREELAALR